MGDYSLQLARAADAPRLAAMSHSLVEEGLRPTWTAARIAWHIRNPDSVVLTARVSPTASTASPTAAAPGPTASSANPTAAAASPTGSGAPALAGFAIMRYGDEIAHLNLLAVEPAHRRRGVATQLIRWLEETADTAGTFVIGLELRAANEGALQLYRKLGYRELERVSGYYQGVEPAIRMSRDLRVAIHPAPTGQR
jgi:ribosomal protein S18 acetylase RimI-like enzyme